MDKGKRKVYLDLVRIIAIFLVIFHHTSGIKLYNQAIGLEKWIYKSITIVTNIDVPLFFMASGSVLLCKVESYKTVLCKRVKRFLIVLLLFSFSFLLLKNMLYRDYTNSVKGFLFDVFANRINGLYSYWYLYAHLGLLFMLPFMQRIAKSIGRQEFFSLLILHFVFSSFVPMISGFFERYGYSVLVSSDFSIPIATSDAFFYPLVGYYIDNNFDIKSLTRKKIMGLISITIVGIMISVSMFFRFSDFVTAIAAFILIKYFVTVGCPKIQEDKNGRIITFLGSLTFGMYLIDPFLKVLIEGKYNSFVDSFVLIRSFGWCIISMILGGTITYMLKKIPVFKQLL